MECDDGDFAKQLMREKLRHERAAYDVFYDHRAWGPPERPPWGRGRPGFPHEYSAVPRYPGGRMEGPAAKKFRGEWLDFPLVGLPGIPPRGAWHHYPRQDFHHHHHQYYQRFPASSAASQSGASSASSSLQHPSVAATGSSSAKGIGETPRDGKEAQDPLERLKEENLCRSMEEFFVQHKDEEWFKHKYHPQEFHRRMAERKAMVKSRKQVFEKLMNLNFLSKVNLEVGRVKDIVKILDAAVILMEGGTEKDLKVLDQEEDVLGSQTAEGKSKLPSNKKRLPVKFTEPLRLERNPSRLTVTAENDGNVSDSGSISDSDDETAKKMAPSTPPLPPAPKDAKSDEEEDEEEPADRNNGVVECSEGQRSRPLHRTVSLFLRNLPVTVTKAEVEDLCKSYPGFLRVALQDPQPENKFLRRAWVTFEPWVNVKDICWNMSSLKVKDVELKPTVNSELKQRVRTVNGLVCHKSVAKQDIKHIVKVVQNLDSLHGVWDDREEEEEEEGGDGNSGGRRRGVSGDADGEAADGNSEERKEIFGFVSKNPLLKNITDFLVDEGSYEEEALLDKSGSYWDDYDDRPKPAHAEVFIEKDVELLKALDKMILYLRIVHSLDYYVAADYQDEDAMPHKCGIIHARASKPTHKVTQSDVNEWMTSFETKISEFTTGKFWLTDEEMSRIAKHEETEVEKFIQANSQELSKDKWLCPLSGKKFKGPDFVRKHIRTKHADKLEQVKMEVEYFNNYARDMRRPGPTETTPPVSSSTNQHSTSSPSSSSLQAGQSTSKPSSGHTPRFVHHYSPIRRPVPGPNVIYRPPYEIRNPGEAAYGPRDFLSRRARFPRPFLTRAADPNGQL